MKRVGFLFEKAFTPEALYQAWEDASAGKRGKRATLDFGRNLASNLDALHTALHNGSYTLQPYKEFQVYEPKERTIFAPAFCDLVVQHAIYKLIYPIFNRTFIDQSYACRKGKGTHAAADYAQAALRSSAPDSYLLQLDIRKFFYSINRAVLRTQIERQIKDVRFVNLMMQFADYGQPVGIPIGNLLSQTYALIYMNPLDHFIKRTLKARRYCRYVDDFVIFGWSRARCTEALAKIEAFIADELHLSLSRHSMHKCKRGLNFVGFRTWRSTRFVRKHSLYTFSQAAKSGDSEAIASCLGHAKRTASLRHMLNILKEIA
ncbi:reverse transcriptase/maturase family protein [Rhodoferax sp.]|uniref:reverse transcriptase/maturase family protein n=1 Tax=Rhodoferax sp. TaxID=50421 RepID=UPI00261AC311|nr:reverse transcriptase/maturase family protein [Rhodoferax sp.]MDD3938096.1 reverse transcriptase/maturase family protein [Rhodoferax sp.]